MNRIYRSIWNQATGAYSAVSENVKSAGKRSLPGSAGGGAHFALTSMAAALMLGYGSLALAGPTGGTVVAGQANITGAPGSTVINQGSQNAVINWANFNINKGESVQFVQPNSNAVALNRVLGNDGTTILGNLSANGKVFIVNPNGILFGQGASVNTAGLVASTLDISNADFMAGNYKFSGNGTGRVLNQGSISAPGGYVALLGANVSNQGTINARLGSVALAAGNAITLDVAGDGLLNVAVDRGAVGALVQNGGLIQADGGSVVLTAQAAGDLLRTVVNNTGVIEAHTIDTRGGTIKLLGDMQSGTVNAGGTLDASAPVSGNGGFIDTSAAHVTMGDGLHVTTDAPHGLTGTWLIDPTDFTVAATGGNKNGAFYSDLLKTTAIEIQTVATGAGQGNININDTISWSANKLTLTAHNNININAPLRGSGTASLALQYGQSALTSGNTAVYNVKAAIDLPSGDNFSTRLGSDGVLTNYTVINSLGDVASVSGLDLQGMRGNLARNYALGSNIDASSTASWNGNLGFAPIGNVSTTFTGKLDGLGHAISGLTMARSDQQGGLFGEIGAAGVVRNLNLVGASVRISDPVPSAFGVGLLAGRNRGLIDNVNVAGVLTAHGPVFGGGMAGQNSGTINNSVSSGTFNYLTGFGAGYGGGGMVNRNEAGAVISNSSSTMTVGAFDGATGLATNAASGMGGLAFYNAGRITNSFATGAVRGGGLVGGLVGYGSGVGVITGSFATGAVSGAGSVGGLVGINAGTVSNSYATGNVAINEVVGAKAGGLVGDNRNSSASISNSYATGNVSGYRIVGGVVGSNSVATISNVYSTGTVTETDTTYHHSGGVVGENINGTVSNGYYNATANAGLAGIGFASGIGSGLAGTTGLSASQMLTAANFTGFNFTGVTPGASGNNWVLVNLDGTLNNTGGAPGATTPMLASEYSTKIYSAHQLQLMAMDTGASYTLAADINAATTGASSDVWRGGTFIPVGRDLNNPFTGSLDGAGHTIYGLVINRPNSNYSGLFGATSGTAIVRNIGLEGGSVTGSSTAGALVGANLGLVDGSYSTVSVTGGGSQIGGLVGLNGITSGVPGLVSNSYASGAVTGTGIVGGLVGSNSGTLTNNYASGTVTGGNTRGGLSGASNGTASGNFWDITLSGTATSGAGTGLTTTQMKTLANFSGAGWDLAGKWISYDGNSAPLLRAFMTPLQVSFASNVSKTYDGTSIWTPPAVTNSDAYAYALLSGSLNYGAAGSAVNAGTYAITAGGLYSGQHGYAISTNAATLTIDKKAATLTGATVDTRAYDGTIAAGISGGTLNGVLVQDTGGISYGTGTFDTKDAGTGKTVTAIIGGSASGNYQITVAALSGDITKKALTVSGVSVASKAYDGNTNATISGGTLNGLVTGETLSLSGQSATFNDRNAGNGKAVTVTGATLATGTGLASNYTVSNATGVTGDITQKVLTVTGVTASDKVYDGGMAATLSGGSLSGLVSGETLGLSTLSGMFGDQNVGAGKAVTVSGGALSDGTGGGLASNYALGPVTGLSASITPKALTVSGMLASAKAYDGNTKASLTGGTLDGLVAGETIGFSGQTGVFADKDAGSGKSVTVSGITLVNGANLASNYSVTNPTGVTGNITPKALTISGVTASDRVYDGSVNATLAGSPLLGGLVGSETFDVTGMSGAFADKNAGTGKAVAITGATLGNGANGGVASNYTVSNPSGVTANISKATISSVTNVVADSKVYDGNTKATVSATGATFNGMLAGDSLSISATSATFANKNAGNGKTVAVSGIALGGLDAANYNLTSTTGSGSGNITQAQIASVSGITAVTRTYDGTDAATLNAGATYNGLLGSDSLTFTATKATFSDKNAGTGKTVNLTGIALGGADAGNYTLASNTASGTGDIAKASITGVNGFTADSKVYDATTKASVSNAGAIFAGMVSGDLLTVSATSATFADKNAGSGKTVTASGLTLGGADAGNYNLTATSGSGTGSISQALITGVSGIAAAGKTYDATTTATVSNAGATFAGMMSGDLLTVSATSATFTDKNAGSGKTVNASGLSLGGTDAGNYNLTAFAGSGTGSITQAQISSVSGITAAGKTYDGTDAATLNAGATFNGLLGSDSLSFTATKAAFSDKNAASGKTVNVEGIVLGGTDAGNYSLASNTATGTGDIARAVITGVSGIAAGDKVYDGTRGATLDTSGATFAGMVGGDQLSASGAGLFADKNAATGKTVTISGIALGGADAGNYTLSADTASAKASISQALITGVTGIAAGSKVYDASTRATVNNAGATFAGMLDGDALTVSATSATFADKNAGSGKTVIASGLSLGGTDAGNYSLTASTGSGTGTITQAQIASVTGITAVTKTYDGSDAASLNAGATYNGLLGSDSLTFTATKATFSDKNAATGKTVNVTGIALGGADAGNYSLASNTARGTGNIAQALITGVSGIAAGSKVYDASTKATVNNAGATFAGMLNGDALTVSSTSATFADKNAGSGKTVTASGLSLGGTDAGNYSLTASTGSGTGTITQAQIASVTGITAVTKTYDGSDAASLNAGATYNGLLGSDSLTFTATKATFSDKNAATGKTVNVTGIALGGADAGNYSLASNTARGTGNIAQALITGVSGIAAGSRVYDASTKASVNGAGATFAGMLDGDALTVSATSATFADKNAGSGKTVTASGLSLGGADAGNYSLTASTGTGTGTITQAQIASVTGITAVTKTYDGSDAASLNAGATYNGLLGSDSLTFTATKATFSDKNAATGKTVNVSGITLGGADAGNYSLASNTASGTGAITPKALTVTGATAGDKMYDGTLAASVTGGALNGLVGGESLSLTGLSGTFANQNVASNIAVTASGATLLDGTGLASNYTVSNPTGLQANITPKELSIGGLAAGNKVYDGTLAANLTGGALQGLVGDETLVLSGTTGVFGDKNAGSNKTVTVSGASLADGTGLASNYTVSNPTGLTANITAKALTVTGQLAGNKVYDGNAVASLSGGVLSGLVAGETLGFGGQSAVFSDKNAANGKTVIVSGTTLVDTASGLASNYSVSNPTGLSANITARALTVTGQLAGNKVYDGNTAASLSGGALSGLVAGETLVIGGQSAVFSDKNAANGKTVTVSGTTLVDTSTGLASNYTVSNPTGLSASITAKALTVTGQLAGNKVYDGNSVATLSGGALSGLVAGETLGFAGQTAVFGDKNAANGKAVTVTGTTLVDTASGLASNYTVSNPTGLTASITAKALTVTGQLAGNKVYDGNTQASLSGGALSGLVAGETLGFGGQTAVFSDKNAANGKTVTVTGTTLVDTTSGLARNYTVSNPTGLTASITPASLLVRATGAASRVYDTTTNASVTLADNRIAGDVLTISNSGASFADKNAGANKTVTVNGIALGGTDAGNYTVNATATTTASITQAALGVKVDNAEKDQGLANPAFTASYTGLLGNDTLANEVSGNLAFSTPATTGSVAGDYLVSAVGQTSTNYALTYTPGVLTVKPTEALQSALASALATVNMVPSQGDMVQAEAVATGDGITSKEDAVQVAQADTPVVQVTASAYANALPGLRLNVVDGGVRLPPEAGNTSLESE